MLKSKRPNGISVLLSAQDEELLIEASAESFLDFADEIIIVVNNSTDATAKIAQNLANKHQKIAFYEPHGLVDLYQNRQYALGKSKYRWIVRADADFIFRDDLQKNYRKKILDTKFSLIPKAFCVRPINLVGDLYHTGSNETSNADPKYLTKYRPAPPLFDKGTLRIFQHTPYFKFVRKGRWETVRMERFFLTEEIEEPLWFHCTFKSKKSIFYRSERTNWREHGNFKRYPSLESYIEYTVSTRYKGKTIEQAIDIYFNKVFIPCLRKYNEKLHFPYPKKLVELSQKLKPIKCYNQRQGHE